MRKIFYLLSSLFLIAGVASPQTRTFNTAANIYSDKTDEHAAPGNVVYSNTASANIDCGAGGKFWTVTTPGGSILEWELSGTTITFLDTLFVSSPIVSLAYCNLLNSGSIPSTMYGSEITTMSYYNGAGWVTITPQQQYSNAGGCGRFLYFMRSGATQLDRYNGTTFTNVVTLQNAQFGIADLAVDTGGRIWSMVAKVAIGDTLVAFDSTGNVVKTYPVSPPIDEDNAYGCFLMDSTLYIGIGNANTSYPNTVIPIRIYADTVIEGNPIPFVNGNFVDMTSCSNGIPLGIQSYVNKNTISFYPNPATNQLTIHTSSLYSNVAITVSMMNVLGQQTSPPAPLHLERGGVMMDVGNLQAGMYFVQVADDKERWVGKFVKQ